MTTHNPGLLGSLSFQGIGWQEEQIIRKLSRAWFITFVRSARFKDSDYVIALAKPTDQITRDFHLDREILVLFTPYKEFQPRAFDFVDKTLFEYQNRLDKLCMILVSEDDEIKGKIRQMVAQDKESRIIVPFSHSEFSRLAMGESERFVNNRLKEFFYTRDLFAFDSPLKSDTYFFGRNQVIQHLYGKYKSGEIGCLFGLRKIGKTSVLYAVKRYLELREEPVVFLDCAETSFHRRRWFEALYFIVENFVKYSNLEGKIKIESESLYTEKDASKFFEKDLQTIQKFFGKKRLLIILDEVENITFDLSPSEHWNTGKDYIYFWQAIRAVYQKNEDLFSVIMAGVNPKAVETDTVQGYDNPIFRWVTPMYLPLFDVNEVKEMVSSIGNYMGLQFENEVFTYLSDDFGGHPFLIRQVCSRIHQNSGKVRPTSISKYRYQGEKGGLNKHVQNYIGLIVNVLKERYPFEYELLEHLAQGDYGTFDEYARLSFSMVEHLIGYGLVKEDGGKYHFRVKSVEEYVGERTKVAKVLNSKEEKWSEISALRNKFEDSFRRVLRVALKLQYGKRGREVFLDVIPSDRKARLGALNFDQIFEAEIYLEDLRKVVVKNWNELGKLFNNDKDHFQTYMEFVNKYRADAHAKDVPDDDISVLQIALKWLQQQVDNFL